MSAPLKKPFASTVSTDGFSFIVNVSEGGDVFVGILQTKGAKRGSKGATVSSLTLSEREARAIGNTLVAAAKVAGREEKSTAFAGLSASASESLGKVLKSAANDRVSRKKK